MNKTVYIRFILFTSLATAFTLFRPVASISQTSVTPRVPCPAVTSHKNVTNELGKPSNDQPLSGTLYNCGNPTAEEQYVIELINRARADPTAEGDRLDTTTDPGIVENLQGYGTPTRSQVKSEFSTYPVRPPLACNPDLLAMARSHSQNMLTNGYQGHSGPDGDFPTRFANSGYAGGAGGENVFDYGTDGWDIHANFQYDFGNYPTIGHRTNIMNMTGTVYTEVGIGIIEGSNAGFGPQFCTEDFGEGSQNFILGVVYSDFNANGFYDIGEGDSGVKITVTGGSSYAVSSGSGGYAIPYSGSGSVTVTASGGVFKTPVSKTIDFSGGENVKVDFGPDLTGYPTQVSLVTPDTTVNTQTIDFVWDSMAVANSYHIQIATDSLMKHLVINDSNLKPASIAVSTLKDSTTYYWRVQAKNAKGTGPWSAIDSFSITLAPSAVVLDLPANGSTLPDSAVYFTWETANKGAYTYWLVVTSDKAMMDTIFQDNTNDTTNESLDVTNFQNGQTYYWDVAAENDNGWGSPSAVWSFIIGSSSVAATSAVVAGPVTISPNPSQGSASLHFTLASSEDVSLLIFNSAGEQVQSLDLGMLPAGLNNYVWDGSGLPNGSYAIQLRMGDQVENARVVILK